MFSDQVTKLQMTFSNSFLCMKMIIFWLNFHWNLFSRVQLTICLHLLDEWRTRGHSINIVVHSWVFHGVPCSYYPNLFLIFPLLILFPTYHKITYEHLKLLTTQLFVQELVHADIIENIKALHYWPFVKEIHQGAVSIRKTVLPGMAIPMLKIRRPNGRLIFNMEIAIRR